MDGTYIEKKMVNIKIVENQNLLFRICLKIITF